VAGTITTGETVAKRKARAGKPALPKRDQPPAAPPPSRGGRPKKPGKLTNVFVMKARNPAWRDWLANISLREKRPMTEVVDAALAVYASRHGYEPPPDREAWPMTIDDIERLYDEHEDEHLEFKNIKPERRLHRRPDLNAFLLLDKLVPGDRDMVQVAEHDEFWVEVRPKQVAAVATEEDILDLMRCGIMYDSDIESFHSFV
jgi:hypothetical protein